MSGIDPLPPRSNRPSVRPDLALQALDALRQQFPVEKAKTISASVFYRALVHILPKLGVHEYWPSGDVGDMGPTRTTEYLVPMMHEHSLVVLNGTETPEWMGQTIESYCAELEADAALRRYPEEVQAARSDTFKVWSPGERLSALQRTALLADGGSWTPSPEENIYVSVPAVKAAEDAAVSGPVASYRETGVARHSQHIAATGLKVLHQDVLLRSVLEVWRAHHPGGKVTLEHFYADVGLLASALKGRASLAYVQKEPEKALPPTLESAQATFTLLLDALEAYASQGAATQITTPALTVHPGAPKQRQLRALVTDRRHQLGQELVRTLLIYRGVEMAVLDQDLPAGRTAAEVISETVCSLVDRIRKCDSTLKGDPEERCVRALMALYPERLVMRRNVNYAQALANRVSDDIRKILPTLGEG